ncbi:MAG: response regulator transcription factor [Lachnospiraceae bacterium]|nr:response regulator transcription factor [Lachnospiraceae bacterium]
MNKQLLIIEDDKKLNDGMKLALKADEHDFVQCRQIAEARKYLKKHQVDLILLDVNLPDGNGIDFVREIRRTSLVPIILITVNNMELDIVTGLEAGANDYITKPFSLMVLRARAAVQLRGTHQNTRIFIQGKLRFDFDKMEFAKGEQMIELSKTEQRLLRLLCENKGATLKRSYLIDQVWQGDTEYVDEHALTVTIKRLRDKLELDPKNPKYIKTVYGIGYMWVIEP